MTLQTNSSASPDTGKPEWPSPIYGWYVVGVLTFAYTVSFIDRQVISLLVIPIQEDLLLSDTQLGLLQGLAFSVFYTLMGLPLGRMADSLNRCVIISVGVTLWSIMTALCGLAQSFWQLFLARVGVGVGEATLSPSGLSIIADMFPAQSRPLAVSFYFLGSILGSGIALIAGGATINLVESLDFSALPLLNDLKPWQLTFILVSLPGLLVLLLMLTVREPSRKEKISTEGSGGMGVPISHVLAFLKRHRRTYAFHNIGFAIFSLAVYGIAAWTPTFFIRVHGWTAGDVGINYGLLVLVCGTSGIVAGGWLTGFLTRRGYEDATYRVILIGVMTFMPFAIAAPLMPSASLAYVMFFPVSFFSAMPTGVAVAALHQITPNEMRGQISAVYLFVANLVGFSLGAPSVGLVTDMVFADKLAVGKSISVVVLVSIPIGSAFLVMGFKSFKRSLAEAKTWTAN